MIPSQLPTSPAPRVPPTRGVQRLAALVVGVVLTGLTACGATGRPVAHRVTAAESEPSSVASRRASQLLELLLRGEYAAATRYLEANAAPGSVAASRAGAQVAALRTLLSEGAFRAAEVRDSGHAVVAQLMSGAVGAFAVHIDREPHAPFRIREARPAAYDRSPGPPERRAAPGSPAAARARELVAVLATGGDDALTRFAASALRLQERETAASVYRDLAELRMRLGAGLTLLAVAPDERGEHEVWLRNARGQESRVAFRLEDQAPYRITITGFTLAPEREATAEEMTPKRVVLSTPRVVAPLSFTNGRPVVEATIEGRGPFRMLIETGCECVHLSPQVVAGLAEVLVPLTDDKLFRAGGTFVGRLHRARSIAVGGATLTDVVVTADNALQGVDGILGLPAFRDLLLTVDYPAQRLVLEQGALPAPDGRQILPMRRVFGDLYGIDLPVGAHTLPALLDTQSGFGLITSPTLARGLHLASAPVPAGEVVMGGMTTAPWQVARLADTIHIGAYRLPAQLVSVIAHPPTRPRLANVGGQLFQHFAVTFDQRTARVRFAREGSTVIPGPGPYRSFGLRAAATRTGRTRSGATRVLSVTPGGAAARAGLRIGDVVARVGGAAVETLLVNAASVQSELDRLAQGGAPVTVEVLRDGTPLAVTLAGEVLVP